MLSEAVQRIDSKLRALHGIVEFTAASHCIFRMEIAISEERHALKDGTIVERGDRIILLHLWNEHIPPLPPGGPTLAWGRRLGYALEGSLRELESYLASRPDLCDVVAIRAEMALATKARRARLMALVAKYGFEPAKATRRSLLGRLHRLGENILVAMLVLVHNPGSFRIGTLRRTCTPILISRAALRERFADNVAKVVAATGVR